MLPVSYLAAPGSGSQVSCARLKFDTCRCPYLVVGSTVFCSVFADVEKPKPAFAHQPLVGAGRREVDAERLTSSGTAPTAWMMSANT